MSIQDNLKKMFTNEEQTVLWKTDIWGTIAVYLTCISCTCFGTSDLNVLLKPFYYRLGAAGSTTTPVTYQASRGEEDVPWPYCRPMAKRTPGAWALREEQSMWGSGPLGDAEGLILARPFLTFWLLIFLRGT